MDEKGRELCPRLIDYLVVVGRRNRTRGHSTKEHAGSPTSVSHPDLLRRYPNEDHKDFYLPNDVTVFCQPEGCTTISHGHRVSREVSFFVFMLTEKDSNKVRYGVCLNFYQSFDRKPPQGEAKHAPSLGAPAASRRRKDRAKSLTSLCLISHHPFISIFHDLLVLLKRLIDACNGRIASNFNIRDLVWSVLTGHWHDTIPQEVMKEIKELETWILMLLSSPVPVPGKTKVQLFVMPPEICGQFEFALPDHTRFSLVDFPLHLPFELLGIDTALKVLSAVMLEQKVVVQSRNYNGVSMCILAFVALLYPLEYMFPVIPLLPAYMTSAEQLLLAPTPFLIGLPATFFETKKLKELPPDIILVDLDTNVINIPEDLEIPDMPEPDLTVLKQNLRRACGKMHEIGMAGNERVSVNDDLTRDGDEIDISVRVAMVKFYNSANVFGNFSEHTRTLRLYPRPVVSLQTDSFLRSRPNCTQFTTELCRTQAVEYFAECSLCPKNETFVRVQSGVENATCVGDKIKWFGDQLMPVTFKVYQAASTLADAILNHHDIEESWSDSDDDLDGQGNSFDDLVFDSDDTASMTDKPSRADRPISSVNDIYREPLRLQLPMSESAISLGSSISSGSPSSMSTSAMDSEADFARLADNLALKSDGTGAFSFDHHGSSSSRADSDFDTTPVQNRKQNVSSLSGSNMPETPRNTGRIKAGLNQLTDSGEKVLGPNLMSAINGYAEKSHDIFSSVLNRTAPKAQALKEKTMRPIAVAAANRMDASQQMVKKATAPAQKNSIETAAQQGKNQQQVREICDGVLNGQGVGVFTYPKLKRLMEDESLRELVCSKLNLGLEHKMSEDEFVREIQLTRAQYKGYVRVLQACIQGLEISFNTPGSNGLASMFHVLEIAHTHFWSKESSDTVTPSSSTPSLVSTPSQSSSDLPSLTSTRYKISTDGKNVVPQKVPDGPNSRRNSEGLKPNGASSPNPSPSSMDVTPVPEGAPPLPPIPSLPPRPSLSGPSGPPPGVAPPPPPRPSGSNLPPSLRPPPLPPRPGSAPKVPPRKDTHPLTANGSLNKSITSPEAAALPITSPPANPLQAAFAAATDAPRPIPPTTNGPSSNPHRKMTAPSTLDVSSTGSAKGSTPGERTRHYIYQDLILPTANPLWQKMVFWENVFVDIVAQEREVIGMDQEPSELIDRYASLSDSEKKRLELEEDRLLGTLLHNLTGYMIMCGTGQKAIQQKIRRLLGKAHIGLLCSKEINLLLDELPQTQGNSIPLKPLGSRLVQKQSFTVYVGSNAQGTMLFMEVCDDAVVLRAVTGAVTERWWYERLVNMTYSPKTKMLCLWRKHEDKVHMHTFYTKKCRDLYNCLKGAMERAAARGKVSVEGRDLGGEFPVHDTDSNQGGLLQVRIDGVAIIFVDRQHFIELSNIKKCNTFGGNVFILEEFDRKKNLLVQRRYISVMAPSIAWAMHRVFSIRTAVGQLPAREGAIPVVNSNAFSPLKSPDDLRELISIPSYDSEASSGIVADLHSTPLAAV